MSVQASAQALRQRVGPLRGAFLVAAHAVFVASAYWFAYLLRFDFEVPGTFQQTFLRSLPVLLLVRLVAYGAFHLYTSLWRYIGLPDLVSIAKATLVGSVVFGGVVFALGGGVPRSVFLIEAMISATLVAGVRLTTRAITESTSRRQAPPGQRAIVLGAGSAGEMLIRELLRTNDLGHDVVALLDDDPRKQGLRIHGVPVVGTLDDLPSVVARMEVAEVVIAIPSATEETKRRIATRADVAGVTIKTMPSTAELLTGKAGIGTLRSATPETLLGRDAIRLDFDSLRDELRGKRVLVTGAGGSIGSELCRQIAAFAPASIVMLDRAESPLFLAAGDIGRIAPAVPVMPIIADITNATRMRELFHQHRPEVLYHAAAYKHVSLMEQQPLDAITNNVFGTETVAQLAREFEVGKFVMISTDKAVRPVGVMGMTKRVAEDLLLTYRSGPTKFVAVRFGNVLGSDGSVLPIFERQLRAGGPITVTDPDATRYFMLTGEAAQLVLQAGAMGSGGEVFFLDMGEPVRIGDLAENFVRMSGLTPHHDIKIEIIGLRPGERLNEELVRESERMLPSPHEKVLVVENHRVDEPSGFLTELEALRTAVVDRRRDDAVAMLRALAARY